jgi:tetratricopeptide (TPR) repeat protein
MPYVRKHGKQLTIVHGERDPGTRKVEQRKLFTLYSREEALEALGRDGTQGNHYFRRLLEHRYPGIAFDWKKIEAGIREQLDVLPGCYPHREKRLQESFRDDIRVFARRLMVTDPESHFASAQVLQEHRHELEYLRDLISRRLKACPKKPRESDHNGDNGFLWHYELLHGGVPVEEEEHIQGIRQRGRLDRAAAGFRLLTECFENYAEGYNYLGTIAMDGGDLEGAISQFRRTIEVGRRLFPRRLRKGAYWSELRTRPYIRGLSNLALALNLTGQYEEALQVCDQLDNECNDAVTAAVHRAAIHLNLGRWREAADAALRVNRLFPEESLTAALALRELGDDAEALIWFLHGALSFPRTARMLVDRHNPLPQSSEDERDDDTGIDLIKSILPYLSTRLSHQRQLFEAILDTPAVDALLDETQHVVRRRSHQHTSRRQPPQREAFDRMLEMRTPEYARAQARELFPGVFRASSQGAGSQPQP